MRGEMWVIFRNFYFILLLKFINLFTLSYLGLTLNSEHDREHLNMKVLPHFTSQCTSGDLAFNLLPQRHLLKCLLSKSHVRIPLEPKAWKRPLGVSFATHYWGYLF